MKGLFIAKRKLIQSIRLITQHVSYSTMIGQGDMELGNKKVGSVLYIIMLGSILLI